MAKNKYTKGTTPIGEAYFASLFKTETFTQNGVTKDTGKYSLMLKMRPEDMDELKVRIDDEWNSYKNTLEGKKCIGDPSNGIKEYKEEEYFKFLCPSEIRCKDGNVIKLTVPVFDSELKEISKKINGIGNGSKVVVAYEFHPYYISSKTFGVSLRLTGVQIVELAEFGAQSGSGLGFGKIENGFAADKVEDSYDEEGIPFTTDEQADEEEEF